MKSKIMIGDNYYISQFFVIKMFKKEEVKQNMSQKEYHFLLIFSGSAS